MLASTNGQAHGAGLRVFQARRAPCIRTGALWRWAGTVAPQTGRGWARLAPGQGLRSGDAAALWRAAARLASGLVAGPPPGRHTSWRRPACQGPGPQGRDKRSLGRCYRRGAPKRRHIAADVTARKAARGIRLSGPQRPAAVRGNGQGPLAVQEPGAHRRSDAGFVTTGAQTPARRISPHSAVHHQTRDLPASRQRRTCRPVHRGSGCGARPASARLGLGAKAVRNPAQGRPGKCKTRSPLAQQGRAAQARGQLDGPQPAPQGRLTARNGCGPAAARYKRKVAGSRCMTEQGQARQARRPEPIRRQAWRTRRFRQAWTRLLRSPAARRVLEAAPATSDSSSRQRRRGVEARGQSGDQRAARATGLRFRSACNQASRAHSLLRRRPLRQGRDCAQTPGPAAGRPQFLRRLQHAVPSQVWVPRWQPRSQRPQAAGPASAGHRSRLPPGSFPFTSGSSLQGTPFCGASSATGSAPMHRQGAFTASTISHSYAGLGGHQADLTHV